MVDKELLQAMQSMIQENNKALGQMMDEKLVEQEKRTDEKLNSINDRLNSIDARFDGIDNRLDEMQDNIAEIKEDTAITRTATNTLVEWADDVSVITQVKFPVKKSK